MGERWQVIGGVDKGGILVRCGSTPASAAEKERLSTGALVEELQLVEGRLQYRLLQGTGPPEGWVAISLPGKELLVRKPRPPPPEWDGVVPPAFAEPGLEGPAQPFEPLDEASFEAVPKPRPQVRLSVKQLTAVCDQNLPGEFHNITFPHSPEQIEEWGPEWLTTAFHKAGTLPEDVTVTKFTMFRLLAGDTTKVTENEDDGNWGGAGMKVMLSVAYSREVPDVTPDFFIKIPHRMGGKSERHKVSVVLNNDFPEVMFNTVCSRKPLPFRCPKCYFADMNRETTNFIVIGERIPYGDKGRETFKPYEILPAPGKYIDFELEGNGAQFYYAQAKAFARMAAWYQISSNLSSQLDYLFMFKEAADFYVHNYGEKVSQLGPIEGRVQRITEYCKQVGPEGVLGMVQEAADSVMAPEVAESFLAYGMDFLETCPTVFPGGVLTPEFKAQFKAEVEECIKHSRTTAWWINKAWPELTVLAHPNLQVDNAFYWKDGEGQMQAGLLDWGSAMHQNIPQVLAGGWHGAEIGVMDEHEDSLCNWFVDKLMEAGGTCCDKETFLELVKLARGNLVTGMFGSLQKLYQLMPKKEWPSISGRTEPRVIKAFLIRCYSTGPMLAVCGFKRRSPLPYLRALLKRFGLKP